MITLPSRCWDCGVVLEGGATRHKPDCWWYAVSVYGIMVTGGHMQPDRKPRAPIARPELDWEGMPERMRRLPLDSRGYPVPWFVDWIAGSDPDGKLIPEFRAMDYDHFISAIRQRLCWVCGGRLGVRMTFVVGPMCGVNRVSSEPPSHYDCARWSAQNCPFLSRPEMVRRETGPGVDAATIQAAKQNTAGIMIERNPGVTLLWTTKSYTRWRDPRNGAWLLDFGDPEAVEWYSRGRPATRAEVVAAVEAGLPALLELCPGGKLDPELEKRVQELERLYPAA